MMPTSDKASPAWTARRLPASRPQLRPSANVPRQERARRMEAVMAALARARAQHSRAPRVAR